MVIFDQLPKLYLGLDEQPEITILVIVGLLDKIVLFDFLICVLILTWNFTNGLTLIFDTKGRITTK